MFLEIGAGLFASVRLLELGAREGQSINIVRGTPALYADNHDCGFGWRTLVRIHEPSAIYEETAHTSNLTPTRPNLGAHTLGSESLSEDISSEAAYIETLLDRNL